jgi:hypothetical protein
MKRVALKAFAIIAVVALVALLPTALGPAPVRAGDGDPVQIVPLLPLGSSGDDGGSGGGGCTLGSGDDDYLGETVDNDPIHDPDEVRFTELEWDEVFWFWFWFHFSSWF